MRNLPKSSAIILILAVSLLSCEKEDDFHSKITLRIENQSTLKIDSIKIYTQYYADSLIFRNLEAESLSESEEVQDIDYRVLFKAHLGSTIIRDVWELPTYNVDPTQGLHTLLPRGYYTFGIIECDTIEESMVIGLLEYYK